MTDTNPYVYELRSTYDDTLVAEFDTQEEARECLWKMYDLEAYRIVKRTDEKKKQDEKSKRPKHIRHNGKKYILMTKQK